MSEFHRWLAEELEELSREGLVRDRKTVRSLGNGLCEVDGRELFNFSSNDYLNLANDPRVIAAAQSALNKSGVGSRASPLVCGRTEWHERLEKSIAEFEGVDGAILFPTGQAANIGTISALVQAQDTIFCDRQNHASLIDGCRLSGARIRVYRHQDLDRLKRELRKANPSGRRWIVTDSVFSMDGDVAPLVDLCNIAEQFQAHVIIDEAHATGVFGSGGRGVAELAGVESRIAVRIGTLSKAIGALGGFVAGHQTLVNFLWNRARSHIYSTALPPAICAAATTSIEIIKTDPCRRAQLASLSANLRELLRAGGIEPIEGSVGPIIPIDLQDPTAAVQAAEQLKKEGFLVAAIRPPTVPRGTSRLRIVVTTAHSADSLNRLAVSLTKVLRRRS